MEIKPGQLILLLNLPEQSDITYVLMNDYSTRQAAQKLGLSLITLQRYIAQKKVPVPSVTKVGGGKLRIWTERDIEKVRRVLPSIKNGRKTRYQKQRKQAKKNQP